VRRWGSQCLASASSWSNDCNTSYSNNTIGSSHHIKSRPSAAPQCHAVSSHPAVCGPEWLGRLCAGGSSEYETRPHQGCRCEGCFEASQSNMNRRGAAAAARERADRGCTAGRIRRYSIVACAWLTASMFRKPSPSRLSRASGKDMLAMHPCSASRRPPGYRGPAGKTCWRCTRRSSPKARGGTTSQRPAMTVRVRLPRG